ncbi:MAG: hypothetical protein LC768_01610 [Acidobacteria bacterium]|nr:hypothetical protein [Acidobacteriota bacterium]MCA1637028.1 hypothetical protein [Acidobacteriota bacterium]
MKSRHITEILDRAAFAELSKEDLTIVNLHAKDCAECRRAFKAAQISSVLLKTQAALEPVAPNAFFQAKVINALRERQNLRKPIAAFKRWWQASAAMVFLMLLTLACLIAVTVLAPASDTDQAQAGAPNFNLYSADMVILDQKPPRDLTTEQVFEVIYETKNDFGKQR